jgi:glyoxylase-like metal-dependent hydrolase (beta-lactamase superfamily II)
MKIDNVKGTLIRTNNYIIGDEKEVILIETSANIEDIKDKVANRKVLAILLTHGHWDHFYFLDKYLSEFKCKVYMTKEAFDKINYRDRTFYADRNPNIDLLEKDVVFIKDSDVLKFNIFVFKVI